MGNSIRSKPGTIAQLGTFTTHHFSRHTAGLILTGYASFLADDHCDKNFLFQMSGLLKIQLSSEENKKTRCMIGKWKKKKV